MLTHLFPFFSQDKHHSVMPSSLGFGSLATSLHCTNEVEWKKEQADISGNTELELGNFHAHLYTSCLFWKWSNCLLLQKKQHSSGNGVLAPPKYSTLGPHPLFSVFLSFFKRLFTDFHQLPYCILLNLIHDLKSLFQ